MSNNRHFLKQIFQERTSPKVNQQLVSKIRLVCQQQPLNLFPFSLPSSYTTFAIFETKSTQETFTVKFAHTQKNFITCSIAMALINKGVFLFRKNHNRNPPEPTKNLAEQTERPIKTNCKPCKNGLWHKNDQK